MSLNSTPSSDRIHIGIFGKRNAGKSSVINSITGQSLAIVSDVKGTTTDPVSKSMELLPLGPVVIIDTPGLDDEGELGKLRIQKAYHVLNKTDIAVLVVDASIGMTSEDKAILAQIRKKEVPYVIVFNKIDWCEKMPMLPGEKNIIGVSTITGYHIPELKELIASQAPLNENSNPLVGDLVSPGSQVILVVPIDKAAPKGRLILPQQQTIRDLLDHRCSATVTQPENLAQILHSFRDRPSLVITDSQVFEEVDRIVPEEIPMTSFSILFARYKGNLELLSAGAYAIDKLNDGDEVLVCEGCTHHRQCGDIGTQKLPALLKKYTGKDLQFTFKSGVEFPEDLSPYQLVLHCGGCMLNEREMKYRLLCAKDQKVPAVNYGIAIAHMKGILARSLKPFAKKNEAYRLF